MNTMSHVDKAFCMDSIVPWAPCLQDSVDSSFGGDPDCYPRAQEWPWQACCVCEEGWRDHRPRTAGAIVDGVASVAGIFSSSSLCFYHLQTASFIWRCLFWFEGSYYFDLPLIKGDVINLRAATIRGGASIQVNTASGIFTVSFPYNPSILRLLPPFNSPHFPTPQSLLTVFASSIACLSLSSSSSSFLSFSNSSWHLVNRRARKDFILGVPSSLTPTLILYCIQRQKEQLERLQGSTIHSSPPCSMLKKITPHTEKDAKWLGISCSWMPTSCAHVFHPMHYIGEEHATQHTSTGQYSIHATHELHYTCKVYVFPHNR